MAKKSSSDEFKNIMTDLEKGNRKPVYLLMGEESYYIDKIYDYIATNTLSEEERDFNQIVMYGSEVTAQQVMDQARRYPMMAEKQVVIVREAQGMKDLEQLERYMDKPVPTTVLVICYMGGTVDARKKIVGKAAAVGTVFVSESPQYDKDIIAFINDYVKKQNATIEERAAQVVAAHIGGDLKRLTSEIDKVFIGIGEDRKITLDIIEQKIGISKRYNVFEMRDALIKKDALKAHSIAKYFDANPKAGGLFALLPQTFSFFQNLMLCYYAPKPCTENAIMAQLGLRNTYATRDYMTAMRNFSARKTLQIISKIREIDARSKGLDNVNTTPGDLLKELVTFIVS